MELANVWESDYTRYADDIAFSGNIRFSKTEREKAKQIIESAGFSINEDKTRIIGGGGRQILAGLIVNSKGLPPRKKRRQWRAIFHRASLDAKKYSHQSTYLRGIASFVNEYNPVIAKEYSNIAIRIATSDVPD